MGNLCGGPSAQERKEIQANREIDNLIKKDKVKDDRYLKLLLLGTGDSGKSTIFKQVKQCYGDKWTKQELRDYADKIYGHINFCVLSILAASKYLQVELGDPSLAKPFEGGFNEKSDITPEVGEQIAKLWQDEKVREIWKRRNEFQTFDTFEYYAENIGRIAVGLPNYYPTFEDTLRCRVRTTGINALKFTLFGANFILNDVGGQRGERRKWISCFSDVVTVLFVAAINEFDQTLFEDNKANRMDEAVKVWEDIVNRSEFEHVGFLLFLNKYDLFKEKIIRTTYKNESLGFNLDYNGPEPSLMTEGKDRANAIISCAEHSKQKFLAATNARTGFGAFSTHYTVATESENVMHVFRTSQDQILRKNLYETGFPI